MGQPLAVAILAARAEAAAGHLGEAGGEARVPDALGDGVGAGQVGLLGHAGAEAGRADHGAVRARQAAIRDLRPARAVECVEQAVMEALGDDRVADRGADLGHLGGDRRNLLLGGQHGRDAMKELLTRRRAGPDDEPVVELAEHEIVAVGHLGAGAHRGAEAGLPGTAALDRDHRRRLAAAGVVTVDEWAAGQDTVVDLQSGELAGSDAEECHRVRLRGDVLDGGLLASGYRPGERHARGVGVALPAGHAHGDVEAPLATRGCEPVAARCLLVLQAGGQVSRRVDLLVADRAVDDGGADDPPSLLPQEGDQLVKVAAREEAGGGGGHHGTGSSREYRSRS